MTSSRPAERVAFTTSRALEYVSEKELTTQIGFAPSGWPLALAKELVDNGLDACEAARVPPAVNVVRGDDFFAVEDGGPGVPPGVVATALDFGSRTSSNSRYVGPTRGQLGNALKCVFAAPAVLFPGQGAGVTVTGRGVEHRVLITPDAIAQAPNPDHRQRPVEKVASSVRVDWPGIASYNADLDERHFYNDALPELLRSFAAFNPHAAVRLDGRPLLAPAPLAKWSASDRSSAHWYTERQLADLVAAHIHRERRGLCKPRSVRELVTNFHGLSGSRKAPAVLAEAGLVGKGLPELLRPDGALDEEAIGRLLAAMRAAASAPKPEKLGVIGKVRLGEALAELDGADPETVRYQRRLGVDEQGRPFVAEVAFAVRRDRGEALSFRFGVNWSPSLSPPRELYELLDDVLLEDWDPATLTIHVVTPLAAYTDAAKSRPRLPGPVMRAVEEAVKKVASGWTNEKRRTERQARIDERQLERLYRRPKGVSLREAAFEVMAEAHAHVTGGRAGAPAHARQIMYAVRKLMQRVVGPRCWKNSDTFTQGLLPDYIAEHPEETAGWNVVYDERGELIEPHGGQTVGLGTLQVRGYLAGLVGGRPLDRYRHVLLVEKEGFRDLIEGARIADRFDVALAWTKGMGVVAARSLIDGLSGLGVTTLVLHDFDTYGLSICHNLCHDGRRYAFRNRPLVRDVGLRLADVEALGLEGEEVEYRKRKKDPRELLCERGVPEAERNYLVRARLPSGLYRGRRVELNELTNDQLLALIERKLAGAGAAKVVPDEGRLRREFEGAWRGRWVARAVEAAKRRAEAEVAKLAPPTPAELEGAVRRQIEGTAEDWRSAVDAMASGALGPGAETAPGGDR